MKKQLLINESEKTQILKMYHLIKEDVSNPKYKVNDTFKGSDGNSVLLLQKIDSEKEIYIFLNSGLNEKKIYSEWSWAPNIDIFENDFAEKAYLVITKQEYDKILTGLKKSQSNTQNTQDKKEEEVKTVENKTEESDYWDVKGFHTNILSNTKDKKGFNILKFDDGTSYYGELKNNENIKGVGVFTFKNGNKIEGTFGTTKTPAGYVTYWVTLKNGEELYNIFEYQNTNVKKTSTLKNEIPLEGTASDIKYCKTLKNYYYNLLKDLINGKVQEDEVNISWSEVEDTIRPRLKECYSNFRKIFSNEEISLFRNPGVNLKDDYQVILEKKQNLKYLIREKTIEKYEDKINLITESKIIDKRFSLITEQMNSKKIKFDLLKEKNNLLNNGYNKNIVEKYYRRYNA